MQIYNRLLNKQYFFSFFLKLFSKGLDLKQLQTKINLFANKVCVVYTYSVYLQ